MNNQQNGITNYNNINDMEYINITNSIINNNNFKKLDSIPHHNSTRLNHSLKVSFYSYKIAKTLRFNYREVAKAGLLHDFFYNRTTDYKKGLDKLSFFTTLHPKMALENAKKNFSINNIEENIITTHMFPLNHKIPTNKESWLVNIVDTVVSTIEFTQKWNYSFSYMISLFSLIFLNRLFK